MAPREESCYGMETETVACGTTDLNAAHAKLGQSEAAQAPSGREPHKQARRQFGRGQAPVAAGAGHRMHERGLHARRGLQRP